MLGTRRPSLTLRTAARQVAGRRSCTVQAVRQRNTSSDRAVQAAEESTEEFQVKLNETIDKLKTKWDQTDEKPAVIGIGVATFVAIWATSGLVDRIDKLPLIGGFLEFVGLLVTAWGVYRYLLFNPMLDIFVACR
eukprot:jgi/Astpho2/9489/Aster-01740